MEEYKKTRTINVFKQALCDWKLLHEGKLYLMNYQCKIRHIMSRWPDMRHDLSQRSKGSKGALKATYHLLLTMHVCTKIWILRMEMMTTCPSLQERWQILDLNFSFVVHHTEFLVIHLFRGVFHSLGFPIFVLSLL